ncbi:MAG TPA: hypothetical protein VGJ84_08410 [Polyangiaceae bacterium]|jgi:hypothetical protein
MAARRKSSNISKSQFVRDLPPKLSAKEVVQAAAKRGMKLNEKYVYNVRSAAKMKGKRRGRSVARSPRAAGGDRLELQLRQTIAQVGLQRARAIFQAVESAFLGR